MSNHREEYKVSLARVVEELLASSKNDGTSFSLNNYKTAAAGVSVDYLDIAGLRVTPVEKDKIAPAKEVTVLVHFDAKAHVHDIFDEETSIVRKLVDVATSRPGEIDNKIGEGKLTSDICSRVEY